MIEMGESAPSERFTPVDPGGEFLICDDCWESEPEPITLVYEDDGCCCQVCGGVINRD